MGVWEYCCVFWVKLRTAKRWVKRGEKTSQSNYKTITFRLPFHLDLYLIYILCLPSLPPPPPPTPKEKPKKNKNKRKQESIMEIIKLDIYKIIILYIKLFMIYFAFHFFNKKIFFFFYSLKSKILKKFNSSLSGWEETRGEKKKIKRKGGRGERGRYKTK